MISLCCRHCGLRDPSWSELDHFVNFLAAQLEACTNSIFCDENIVGDTLRGMKDFVVKFMIRMSRVSSFGAQMTFVNSFQIKTIGFCHTFIARRAYP